METTTINSFYFIGLPIRTTNENNQAAQDLLALWTRFMSEHTITQIPNKIDNTIYCMYTDYEKDHTAPYTAIIGCKVKHLDTIPKGLIGKTIQTSRYTKFVAKGKINEGSLFKAWNEIWNAPIKRSYTADFEVYDENVKGPDTYEEIDIFIAVD